MNRKVFIKSNQAEGVYTHESVATTFGELKAELGNSAVKFSFTSQRAVVKPGMIDLKEDAAALPVGDFYLFLIPEKQKAGANVDDMGYQELKAAIKDNIDSFGDEAKAHFGNYTILSSQAMREKLKDFSPASETSSATVDTAVNSAVESLAQGVALINEAVPVIAEAIKNLQALALKGVLSVPAKVGGYTLEELAGIYAELEKTTKK